MHGIIFSELKKFVATRHGEAAWKQVLEGASLANRTYLVTSQYPDEEVVRLVQSAVRLTHAAPTRLLEDFGEFPPHAVEFGGTRIAEPARRWAIRTHDGGLVFADTEQLVSAVEDEDEVRGGRGT